MLGCKKVLYLKNFLKIANLLIVIIDFKKIYFSVNIDLKKYIFLSFVKSKNTYFRNCHKVFNSKFEEITEKVYAILFE